MKNKVNSKLEWIRNFFFDSRKDGADRIGVTANYLCQIETGTKVPRLKGLCKFSYAYGIPLDILFSDERRFLIYSIEAMSALSEKSEIDKLIEGLQCLQKSLTLQSQEDDSQPGSEKQINTASDWINTGNSYEIVRTVRNSAGKGTAATSQSTEGERATHRQLCQKPPEFQITIKPNLKQLNRRQSIFSKG